jgi:hypothetical protein
MLIISYLPVFLSRYLNRIKQIIKIYRHHKFVIVILNGGQTLFAFSTWLMAVIPVTVQDDHLV